MLFSLENRRTGSGATSSTKDVVTILIAVNEVCGISDFIVADSDTYLFSRFGRKNECLKMHSGL